MSHFLKLITRRRSVRQYEQGKPLSPSDVKKIMKAALMSPTSKNSRPCHFVLVEDKTTLKTLSVCKLSGASFLVNCSLAIVVVSDPLQSEAAVEDATIAATYIQLEAEDLHLGSCWVHIRERKAKDNCDSEQYVRNVLNIPNSFHVECIISIGWKIKENKPHNEEELLWEKLHKGTW